MICRLMKRQNIIFLLALLMSMVGAKTFAYDAKIDGIYYNFSETNATVTYFDCNLNRYAYTGNVVIPETVTYNGSTYFVTSIGDEAFTDCSGLMSVDIGNSVTRIGDRAFSDCFSMTSVAIGKSVTRIGDYAFKNCIGLTSITIPESVTRIGDSAFRNCTALTSITIPESVNDILAYTFDGCTGLTSITMPEVVYYIGDGAFRNCTALTSITIPESVTHIGQNAFSGCYFLAESFINLSTRPAWGATLYDVRTNEGLLIKDSYVEKYIGTSPTVTIPDYVTGIGSNAFSGCTGLTSITIPESVTGIGMGAFQNCTSLTSITIPESVTRIDDYAFSGCSGLTSINIPESVTRIGNWTFSECTGLTSITIPESVTSIGSDAFHKCYFLAESFINQSTLTSSYNWGAVLCDEITSEGLRIKDGIVVKYTGTSPSVTIPDYVAGIGDYAFNNCTGLTSITIPESVTSIGNNAFRGCYFLAESFINQSTLTSSYNWGAILCDEITSEGLRIKDGIVVKYTGTSPTVTIPNYVTGIGSDAFRYCTSLNSITIPESVTSIIGGFSGCNNLTSVIVHHSTPLPIESNTFSNRANATLYVPYGSKAAYKTSNWDLFGMIVEMEPPVNIDDTFTAAVPCGEGTASLTFKVTNATPWEVEVISSPENIAGALTIPATVTDENGIEFAVKSIGEDAFRGRALTSVVLPTGICTINSDAFRESGLESITFPSTLSAVWHGAFQDCKQLESIDFNHCPAYFEYDCFLGCSNLKELYIPNTVQFRNSDNTWAWNIFGSCTSLKTVTFEAFEEGQSRWSTTTLFPYCSALETVVLPSMSVMQQSFFWNSKNLKDITILEIEDDFDARYYSFNKMFQDHQAKDIQFTVPAGKAETMLKAGYINLSDKSGLPIVRTEFESEAARITTMANALNDGAKASLITAIANARSVVNAAEDYATVYAQIDAIKTAAKTFLTTTTVPANFDITAVILNPDFEQLQLGWNVQNDWVNYPNVNKRGLNGASYENGEVSIDKFIDTWENTTLKDGDISQTIKALPAGIYRLEADIIATNQNDANAEVTGVSLFAGNQKTAVATENEKPQRFGIEFTLDETCDCTIGINVNNTNANWVAMDNVRLYSVRSQEDQNNTDISQLDNAIYIEPFTTRTGVAVKIPINLKNAEAATAYVFDLVLPEGITVAKNSNGKYMDELSDRHDSYIPIFNYKGENTYGFSTLSGNSEELTGNDGPIRFVTLHVENAVEEGVYPILIKNASYSKPNGNLVTLADTKSSVTIETIEGYVLGDVNGNGGVDIGDAVSIVSYLVGKESSNFVAEAADTNNNGQIDIGDAVIIVNLLVGKITHFTREFNIIWDEKEPE